jgi:hypothetical protein
VKAKPPKANNVPMSRTAIVIAGIGVIVSVSVGIEVIAAIAIAVSGAIVIVAKNAPDQAQVKSCRVRHWPTWQKPRWVRFSDKAMRRCVRWRRPFSVVVVVVRTYNKCCPQWPLQFAPTTCAVSQQGSVRVFA